MRRYWVIAPYESKKRETFNKAWEYDLKNGTIAIGWTDLGDITKMDKEELKHKYLKTYPKGSTIGRNTIWKFYHVLSIGDIIIAKKGRKSMVGIGEIVGKAFYDLEKGNERVKNTEDRPYPNFIQVKWEEKIINYERMVFGMQTLSEISEEKYNRLLKGEVVGREKKVIESHVQPNIAPINDNDITRLLQILACSPPQPFLVDALHRLDIAGKIIYNTEFQRGEVWDLPRKQKLIDSILRGYNINTIFLRQIADGRYECLDGQQRLKTILKQFLGDKFPINPKYSQEFNKATLFSQLPEPLKSKIKSYIIYAIIFYTTDDEETCKIFLRLQEGLPLNSAEKLNAMIGVLRNEIVDLTHHPFMAKLGIKNHRFVHRYILAQLYLLILREQITDIKFKYLQEIYDMYKNTRPPVSATNTVKRILNFLIAQFGDDAQVIKFNGDFISLSLLAEHLLKNYALNSSALSLKEFFIPFAIKVNQMESSEKEEDVPYYDYRVYRKATSDSKDSIVRRHDIITSKFLEFNPGIKPKDPNRNFDYWEKLAVYWRDRGTCKLRLEGCKNKTSFEEGTVDHKTPHSRGGLTTIANGQWACIKCNLKKGAKDNG